MDAEAVRERLASALSDCEIQVENDGNHFLVIAIGDRFEGMSRVKQQQLIYGELEDALRDGSIHALTIKAFTPGQWQSRH
ncbi:MAG: BolA/IbaG family iron-sulfur metabolism protein [Oleiphilaceae bacterium]|nr:BolA/IbaG family iron-sulfur metabolism protein [Oleiphilaceae bacterium]